MTEKSLAPPIQVTWPMVASLIGAMGTIGIAATGGLLTVMLHLDGQHHKDIEVVREEISSVSQRLITMEKAVSANTALLRQLLEAQP